MTTKTTQALVTRIAELTAELGDLPEAQAMLMGEKKSLKIALDKAVHDIDKLAAERDALAALRAQEPIGKVESAAFGAGGFHVYLYPNQHMPKVGTNLFAAPVPPVREPMSIQQRATELVEKSFMPWDEAERLALSEIGITDADIAELEGNCCRSTILTGDDISELIRSVLVHGAGLLSRAAVNGK